MWINREEQNLQNYDKVKRSCYSRVPSWYKIILCILDRLPNSPDPAPQKKRASAARRIAPKMFSAQELQV